MFLPLLRSTTFAVLLVPGTTSAGNDPLSKHLHLLGADAWHAQGIRGRGMTIAVLDHGFRGYRTQLGKALPQNVRARSFRSDCDLEFKNSPHGILCAEVVHAIAPEAALVLANWEPDRSESFLQAVKWAREQGASIITCSIVVPGWSDGDGGGAIHRELAKLLDGALFFASAGNLAQRHWTGHYDDDGENRHQWQSGRSDNIVLPWGDQPVSVEICGRDAEKLRLTVLDAEGRPAGRSRPLPTRGVHGSTVRFIPEGGQYRVRVELADGRPAPFRLVVLGGDLEIATAGDCMVFPGDGDEVIAVAAVDDGGKHLKCSSTGTTKGRIKPDCAAPVPFPSSWRAAPFGGTSAAAPQAAGVAALLWSKHPGTGGAAKTRALLRQCCVDVGIPGPDCETGYGQIKLP